jgi:hypothetical protein
MQQANICFLNICVTWRNSTTCAIFSITKKHNHMCWDRLESSPWKWHCLGHTRPHALLEEPNIELNSSRIVRDHASATRMHVAISDRPVLWSLAWIHATSILSDVWTRPLSKIATTPASLSPSCKRDAGHSNQHASQIETEKGTAHRQSWMTEKQGFACSHADARISRGHSGWVTIPELASSTTMSTNIPPALRFQQKRKSFLSLPELSQQEYKFTHMHNWVDNVVSTTESICAHWKVFGPLGKQRRACIVRWQHPCGFHT